MALKWVPKLKTGNVDINVIRNGIRTKNNWTKSIGLKITMSKLNWTKSIAHKDIKYFMLYLKQLGTHVSNNIKNTFYVNIYNFLHIYQLSNLTQSHSIPYSLEEVFHTFAIILHHHFAW